MTPASRECERPENVHSGRSRFQLAKISRRSRMDPKQLRYAPTHEWAHLDNGVCTVGITQFAVEQLTDVTHVELPKPGRQVQARDPMGEIESVKAVSDIYA